jgi:apolipoprotein N-acyltransferase
MKLALNREKIPFLACFLAGMLYATAFPMTFAPAFPLGSIIAVAILFYYFSFINEKKERVSLRHDFLLLILFSLGYNLLGYYWIPETLREFGRIFFPFNYLLGTVFSLVILPHYLLFILLVKILYNHREKFSYLFNSTSTRNLSLALALTLLELWTPQQFPAHLAHPFLHMAPYLGLAPILGSPIFSFMGYLAAFFLMTLVHDRKLEPFFPVVFIPFIIINIAMPLPKNSSDRGKVTHRVRLVQANVPNNMKINSERGTGNSLSEILERYFKLSARPGDKPIDLVIWPETAYAPTLNTTLLKQGNYPLPRVFQKIIEYTNAEIFFGGYAHSSFGEQGLSYFETQYNTTFLISEVGHLKDYYYKMKLIPFGETLPFGPLNKFLSRVIDNVSYFASGDRYTLFKTRKETPFITAICYEILFTNLIRNYLGRVTEAPHFLINLTNDSWYGDTAEPYQHLFLSKWRALEFVLPIIRMTNTGITSIIYPDGSESERINLFEERSLDIDFTTYNRRPQFYERWGVIPTLIIGTFLILAAFLIAKRRKITS